MRTCSIIGAVILSIFAIPMIIGSILLNGFANIILTDSTFVANLSPQRIQAHIIEALPALLNSVVANPGDNDTNDVYNTLFPDPTLRTIAREQMPAIIDGMHGDISQIGLGGVIDTQLPALMQQVVESAPPCTAAQERDLQAIIVAKRELGDNVCQPSTADAQQQLIDYMSTQMRAGLTGETLLQNPDNPLTAMQMRDITDAFASITQSARQGIVWPAVMIVLILALAVRTLRGLFGWLGSLTLLTGGGGMAVALLSKSLLSMDIPQLLQQNIPEQYQIIAPFLTIFEVPVFATYVQWLTTVFSGCLIAGGICVVIALVLRPRRALAATVLVPLPGTPQAQAPGNDGTTAPVAVELDTGTIPVGKVTGPLSATQAATTDAHQFDTTATPSATTSELATDDTPPSAPIGQSATTSELTTDAPSPPPSSVGTDSQGR